MQNISSEIGQFVMMNQKVKNKEQVAKKILDETFELLQHRN